MKHVDIDDLRCKKQLRKFERLELSLGSLGSGNHFIEINEDDEGYIYIVIHSGSRNLGKQVCDYYQKLGYTNSIDTAKEREKIIETCKLEKRQKDISTELAAFYKTITYVDKSLAYVEGSDFDDYIHDMKITQEFALWNRKAMMKDILDKFKFDVIDEFTTIHNYIDTDNMMLRKGAISAQLNEVVLIPMNMRDGSLICVGKGNKDWNYSAPHGAGRIMSRSEAKRTVSMQDYKDSMKDVYSTCVTNNTIDESPFAYKPMEEIIKHIKDTVDIKNVIKPIYNFKG